MEERFLRDDGVGARTLAYKACGLVLSYYFYFIPSLWIIFFLSKDLDAVIRFMSKFVLRAKTLVSNHRHSTYIPTLVEKDGSLSLSLSSPRFIPAMRFRARSLVVT